MYLLRMHMEGVGHREARFDPLTLEFTEKETGSPLHTAMSLRNGGGKTSKLALFYSLFLPGKREFLGSRRTQRKGAKNRSLDDYVLQGEIGHVAAEWGEPEEHGRVLPGLEGSSWTRRLITGQILYWKEAAGKKELHRDYYIFQPRQGGLDFESLPYRTGGSRTPASRFIDLLKERAPGVRFAYTQTDWRSFLDGVGLDPELFRYQLAMNDHEGGAEEFMNFVDGNSFVAFLLDLVTDPVDVDLVDKNITRVADQFASHPTMELELDLATGIVQLSPPLIYAWNSLSQAVRDRQDRRVEGATLLARIKTSIEATRGDKARELSRQTELEGARTVTERERDGCQNKVEALDDLLARCRLRVAEESLKAASEVAKAQAKEVAAWAIVEQRHSQRELKAEADVLKAALDQAQLDAADLRVQFQAAAARYRIRLETHRAEEKTREGEASQEAEEAGERAKAAAERARALDKEISALTEKTKNLSGRLEELKKQQAEFVRSGALLTGENPADALERLNREIKTTEGRLEEFASLRDELTNEERSLREGARIREGKLGELGARLKRLGQDRDKLQARLDQLAAEPEIQALISGEEIDILAAAPTIKARLLEQAREADQSAIGFKIDSLEIERAIASLGSTRLLPVSRDVEKAIQILASREIGVVSGWEHLAKRFSGEGRRELIALAPDLPSGVVVNVGRLGEAVAILQEELTVFEPLTVTDASAWDAGAVNDRTRRAVLLPSAGRYDPDSAAEEVARREAEWVRVEANYGELTRSRDKAKDLCARLDEITRASPEGGLGAYDRDIDECEDAIQRLKEEALSCATRLGRISGEQSALKTKAKNEEEIRKKLSDQRWQVSSLVRDTEQSLKWQRELEETKLLIAQKTEERDAADSAAKNETTAAETARQRAEATRRSLVELGMKVGALGGAGVGIEVGEDSLATDEQLERMYSTSKDAYELRTSKSETAIRLGEAEKQLGRIADTFKAVVEETLTRADELLDGPDGKTAQSRQAAWSLAREAETAATQKKGERQEAVRLAEIEAKAKRRVIDEKKLPPLGDLGVDCEEVGRQLEEANQKWTDAKETRAAIDAELGAVTKRFAAAVDSEKELDHQRRTLELALRGEDISDIAVAPALMRMSGEEAATEVDRLIPALEESKELARLYRDDLQEAAKKLRSFVQGARFASLEGRAMRDQFVVDSDDLLATTANEQKVEYERRIASLKDDIAAFNTHRRSVTSAMTELVKGALRTLDEATKFKLPSGLGGWSEQSYLTISYGKPDPQLLESKVETFVDAIVRAERARPGGMDLLIRAVQEAVGESFGATVLKPNEGLPLVRESVAMVSNWSGGQKLTTALLLYCTLARLRATNRKGRGGSRMSVLILDNPLGTANHIDLVDLQLTVAHLTGLQLIIATGVNDEDAIAAYPNIIRLRNLKDQNGHRSYVRVQREADGVVEAVRVYRKNGTTLREVHAN